MIPAPPPEDEAPVFDTKPLPPPEEEAPIIVRASMCDTMVAGVHESGHAYVYDPASRISQWYLSSDVMRELEEQLITNGKTALARGTLKSSADETMIEGISVELTPLALNRRESQETLAKVKMEDESNDVQLQRQDWVIRVHPDCGQLYYMDVQTHGLSSWHNPFAGESISEQLDREDHLQLEQNEMFEQEKLAGLDLAPKREIFSSVEAEFTKKRISEWMVRNYLEVTEVDAPKLKFPEYVDFSRDLAPTAGSMPFAQVNIIMPMQHEGFRSFTLAVRVHETVQQLLDTVFAKFKTRTGVELDPEGTSRYVFKVAGYSDFLIHPDYLLGMHDVIMWCLRKNMKIELELLKLSDADMMDLAPILAKRREESAEDERNKCRPEGDDFSEDEKRLLPPAASMFDDIGEMPMSDIHWPFRCLIRGVENCPDIPGIETLVVEAQLFFNGQPLVSAAPPGAIGGGRHTVLQGNAMCTPAVPYSSEPRFPAEWLVHTIEMCNLPPTTRIAFQLFGYTRSQEKIPLAGVSITIVDCTRTLIAGKRLLRMWPSPVVQMRSLAYSQYPNKQPSREKETPLPRVLNVASCVVGENKADDNAMVLHIVFDSYTAPVRAHVPTLTEVKEAMASPTRVFGTSSSYFTTARESLMAHPPAPATMSITQDERERVDEIDRLPALSGLSHADKNLLWNYRQLCTQRPTLLPKFLQAVNWCSAAQIAEAHRLLVFWATHTYDKTIDYIELLDIRFSDPVVREYAVRRLDSLPDSDIAEYLLQMVQVLKYEAFHDSPLARMLLRRALLAPYKIGHLLFWMLRSELHNEDVSERYGTLLFLYVKRCGPHMVHLRRQVLVNDKIRVIADTVKTINGKDQRTRYAREELAKLNPILPSRFQLCLSPRIECKSIVVDKCKVMDSKKKPLWLVFENADPNGERYLAIFKAGDDLRQDQMTLQMLRVMDRLWIRPPHNLDLRLNPYGCCSTGQDLGMIEVVKNSKTTSEIQRQFGGRNLGALKSTPIQLYLNQHNKGDIYRNAVDNFILTCAGYCVATYVLGIGDRHNDNIMCTESGHLFHIDFGHFLGNFKSKMGIRRERAPFVFTPEMAYVMEGSGSDRFRRFKELCCQAFNLLRERINLFLNLFILMVPAGMPELLEKDDVTYLLTQLAPEMTPEQAGEMYQKLIMKSLGNVARLLDNSIHNWVHG